MASPPFSFVLSPLCPPSAYKLILRLPDGLLRSYVPAFPQDSQEFERLQDYYGDQFLSRVLPEKYGYPPNVLKTTGCVQVRFTDLTEFICTKRLLKLALAYWQDFSSRLKRRSPYDPQSAFQELTQFRRAISPLSIPGLSSRLDSIAHSLRREMPILVLIEPWETLFYREAPGGCGPGRAYDLEIAGKYYWFRRGAKRFLRTITHHPRSVVWFYSCLHRKTLAAVCPVLSEEIGYFGGKYCEKDSGDGRRKAPNRIWLSDEMQSGRFQAENTVLVENDPERCKGVSAGVILVSKYEGSRYGRELKRLTRHIIDILDNSDYDLLYYLSQHPYTG